MTPFPDVTRHIVDTERISCLTGYRMRLPATVRLVPRNRTYDVISAETGFGGRLSALRSILPLGLRRQTETQVTQLRCQHFVQLVDEGLTVVPTDIIHRVVRTFAVQLAFLVVRIALLGEGRTHHRLPQTLCHLRLTDTEIAQLHLVCRHRTRVTLPFRTAASHPEYATLHLYHREWYAVHGEHPLFRLHPCRPNGYHPNMQITNIFHNFDGSITYQLRINHVSITYQLRKMMNF